MSGTEPTREENYAWAEAQAFSYLEVLRQRDEARAELASLRAVVEQVRALHPGHGHAPDGKTWTYSCLAGCGPWPCATVALLPEATS